jgi:hypothetical protein
MVVGPGEGDRYLKESLNEFTRLADDAVIALNNVDEVTRKIVKESGFWYYDEPREWGIHQPHIKTDLLTKIGKLAPDTILALDADERYDSSFSRERVEEYAGRYPACYFYIVNHWNDRNHHRKSLGFWNVRMFNWLPQFGVQYQRKNLHCGLGPPWAYSYGSYVPHFIHHYGLMDEAARKRKVARYEKYDPNAKWKDRSYYEALKTETTGSEFIESEMRSRLQEEVAKMGNQQKSMLQADKPKNFVYVRRLLDGAMLDVTAVEWEEMQKTRRGQFELIGDVKTPNVAHKEIAPPEKEPLFQCPLCGSEFKTALTLARHKKSHA